ncbi:MAG TPA: hypothetical protein VJ550_17270 [Geomonas sp.]|nr:hypothetical protein [Geomonas sp.]
MFALVKLSRVFPLVYPEIFRQSVTSDGRSQPATAATAASRCETCQPDAPDVAAAIQAERLKSLYRRTLRNQGHRQALTYSGRLTA